MFDVGFSELVVIALVALIVIGPERLPKVARTVGILLGRLQRYVNDVKSDINREMQLDELKKLQEQVASQVRDIDISVSQEMRAVEDALNQTIAPPVEPVAELPASEGAGHVESAGSGDVEPLSAPVKQAELDLSQSAEKIKA